MSKGLKALEKINHTVCLAFDENNSAIFNKDQYEHIDCKDINEFIECYDTIEKELKALKIIKEKNVDVALLKLSENVERYNSQIKLTHLTIPYFELIQKEYDLLREVAL